MRLLVVVASVALMSVLVPSQTLGRPQGTQVNPSHSAQQPSSRDLARWASLVVPYLSRDMAAPPLIEEEVAEDPRGSSDKRQFDDYGHMRFGKREFDDYGHMRFGRSVD